MWKVSNLKTTHATKEEDGKDLQIMWPFLFLSSFQLNAIFLIPTIRFVQCVKRCLNDERKIKHFFSQGWTQDPDQKAIPQVRARRWVPTFWFLAQPALASRPWNIKASRYHWEHTMSASGTEKGLAGWRTQTQADRPTNTHPNTHRWQRTLYNLNFFILIKSSTTPPW